MNMAARSPRAIACTAKVQGEQRLAGPGGPEDQGARPALDAAAEQRVELRRRAWQRVAVEVRLVLRRDQAREDVHAARLDHHVVKAAAELLAAIFDHPHPPPLGAVIGRELLQPDDPVGDAVHGLVVHFGGEVVEHDDGAAVAREIMLERQHLAPIAKRALREQPDFRQAVDDDAIGLVLLDRLEDALGGLAELEVGRIEQALLLVLVEQAFRRHQLVDGVGLGERPAVGGGAFAQLRLGFRQGDVQAALARRRRRSAGIGWRWWSCRCRGCLRPDRPARAEGRRRGYRRGPRPRFRLFGFCRLSISQQRARVTTASIPELG